jgi:MSHA pilin protein MshC
MENNKLSGFTLIELVMMLVILSVISATAIPSFFDKNVYAERAFFDDTLHAVQYAQKLSVATGCGVRVSISSNRYTLTRRGTSSSTRCTGATFSLDMPNPGTGASSYSGSEKDITLSSSSTPFYFYSSGSASADVTLTVNGSRTIRVIAETGFVYDSTP